VNRNQIEFSQILTQGKSEKKDLKLVVNTFQQENCNYSLLYFSEPSNYESEIKNFDQFTNTFEVK
jgi:hypothetical protein